tara:strand:- start:18887 stop:19198 length:312 start_codon:yes stop_codon:yes gene_type:complete
LPACPQIQQPDATVSSFLAYAPELPDIVAEQQHILEPPPPAPHTSNVTAPDPGDIQQKQPGYVEYVAMLEYDHTLPFSRFVSVNGDALLANNAFNPGIFYSCS